MRLIKILFAFMIFGIMSSLDRTYKCRTEVACDGADEVPSDVAFAVTLLKFGKYFLVIAVILVVLFM